MSGATQQPASSQQVEIIRDKWGVAHVYAENEPSLFYGAGYATAEDRMFQMMIRRRLAIGQIAEILGPGDDGRHLALDRRQRVMGLGFRARQAVERMAPDARANLEAYAEGVSAYLADHRGRLSPLFAQFGGEPEPWTAADCIAVWEAVAHRFSFGWPDEAKAKREFEAQGKRWPEDIPAEVQPLLDDSAQIVSEEEFRNSFPEVHKRLMAKRAPAAGKAPASSLEPPKLSHNWVVSGARSKTGKPIVESDPQYGVNNPAYWYEIHLTGGRYNARGAGVPGSPVMLIYWNETFACSATGLGGDDGDLFEEKTDPNDPNRYEWQGEWRRFETRRETIRVKGQEPVELEVRVSRHGPVVNDIIQGVKPGEVFALSQSNWAFGLNSVEAMLNAMQAADCAAFREAMSRYASPPLHYTFADAKGNIGHQVCTATPIRRGPRALPRVGWTGADEWERVPFDELPAMMNPKSGYISTANNMGAGSWHPYRVGAGLGDGPRSWRLREIFEGDPARKFSVRDFVEIVHRDCVSSPARDAAALIVKIAEEDGVADPKIKETVAALKDWDGRLLTSLPTFALGRGLLDAIDGRKLKGSGLESRYPESWAGIDLLLKELAPPLRKSGQTPKDPQLRRWLLDLAREAFDRREHALHQQEDTTGWVKETESAAMDAHVGGARSKTAFIRHMPYGDTPEGYGAERFGSLSPEHDLDSPPLLCPVIQTIWSQEGNSYCHVADLSDPDGGLSLLAPGLSEDPASPHFKDQLEIWAAGELHPAPLTRKGVEKVKASAKVLERGKRSEVKN